MGSCVYPIAIHNYLRNNEEAKPTNEVLLREILDEIKADPDLKIRRIICDTPERHRLKNLVSASNGYFSYEICIARGTNVTRTDTGRKKKLSKEELANLPRGTGWHFLQTVGAELRTMEMWEEVTR